MTRSDLPRRVYERHGSWYFVDASGRWHKLCRVRQGLPAMYRALADLTETEKTSDRMPAVISRWLAEKAAEWSPKTSHQMGRIAAEMADYFREYAPADIKGPECAAYLKQFAHLLRTHNQHRTALRQVLSFAAVEGLREGWNPIDDVPAKALPERKRIVADAEVEAIKRVALQAENGDALVRMIDLALITGQRISDLISMTWADVGAEGISVTQQKTGERLLIEWSPALRAAVDACAQGAERAGALLKTRRGGAYTYSGIATAWKRARAKVAETMPGVRDLRIHDLRGRAGVDVLLANGEDVRAAQRLLGHSHEKMTRHYVDRKYHKRAKPSR